MDVVGVARGRWIFALLSCAALAAAGCGDDDGPGPGADSGIPGADAGSAGGDAGPGGSDGGAGGDAGLLDGGPATSDAGGCVLCTNPVGCTRVGPTCASCGTLVCGDGGAPTACGGRGGAMCGAGQFCDYALEDVCGAADATGVCTARPDVCPREPPAVCGCDGLTYTNVCSAHRAGVAVASTGACP